jgi:Fic family protein
MDPKSFTKDCPGELVAIPEGAIAFVPHRMPRDLMFLSPTPLLIEKAGRELGRLFEKAAQLPNPNLLIEPLIKKEAEFSSRIEGTVATQEELALFETPGFQKSLRPEVQEVHNYVEALKYGLDELKRLPICLRLVRDLHGKLMKGVRGQDQRPGEFRSIQNQVSRPGQPIALARYVPPPVSVMTRCLDEFERDVHELKSSGMPQLAQAALIHYQFEAIHPFRDGNGRIGRMLIPLFLAERELLPYPLLHLSGYFDKHRTQYANHLLQVSQTGAYFAWVEFFLQALSEEARRSIELCHQLLALREKYLQAVRRKRASSLLPKLIDFLFVLPVITVPLAAQILEITYAAAKANVLKLEEATILVRAREHKNMMIWRARGVIELLSN